VRRARRDGGGGGALLLAAALALAAGCGGRPAPEPLSRLPEFALTASDGSTVTRESLAGAPWVADFIFTRCVAYCPRLTARMKELRTRLPARVRSVSFSVDPAHDTPEVLAAYARDWQAEGPEWIFLTGERDEIWSLIRVGFLLPVEEAPDTPEAPVLHSNRFALVDSAGAVRGTYEAFEEDALDRLLADLAAVEREEGSR